MKEYDMSGTCIAKGKTNIHMTFLENDTLSEQGIGELAILKLILGIFL